MPDMEGPSVPVTLPRPGSPLGPGLAACPVAQIFRELAVVSFGQVVSASSIVGKMVNTGPGPVARKAGNRERT
jgi:hypothetical protein